MDWMDTKGLSWVTWSVSDKNESCSVLKPAAKSGGSWNSDVIKESGIKAKEYLAKYLKSESSHNMQHGHVS